MSHLLTLPQVNLRPQWTAKEETKHSSFWNKERLYQLLTSLRLLPSFFKDAFKKVKPLLDKDFRNNKVACASTQIIKRNIEEYFVKEKILSNLIPVNVLSTLQFSWLKYMMITSTVRTQIFNDP